uniref:TBC1 domain family member 14 isoform X1 n=1 Tax=Ciona intestinalis TaxID=7719 RepID=UPI000EF4D18D|nr:TBC1 domain family member 14 isoform X1 [Ciona intestinalis]|eukprot:XP_026690734.1 TBC1 domain family member 14 isoform X1 [Ciona intestinalis]
MTFLSTMEASGNDDPPVGNSSYLSDSDVERDDDIPTLDVSADEIQLSPDSWQSVDLGLKEINHIRSCTSTPTSIKYNSTCQPLNGVSHVPNLTLQTNLPIQNGDALKLDINEQDTIDERNGSINPNSPEFLDITLQTTEVDEPAPVVNKPGSSLHSKKGSITSLLGWISSPLTSSPQKQIPQVVKTNKETSSTHTAPKSPISFRKKRFWRSKEPQPMSTTALILEDRPSNLPKKSAEESEKHRLQYKKMVEIAKKNELKDVQKRNKLMKEQRKQEDTITSASSQWISQILPNWEVMHQNNKVRMLWWQGLPPNVRGKVWQLSIGNELNITEDLYSIMVVRFQEKIRSMHETQSSCSEADTISLSADRESTVELIRLDISRTFPHLCIFQKGGPYHDVLHDILGAYACYRPDVGYVQGMSFVAAMLLLNMEPAYAFITFSNLLNKPCQLAFFRLNEELMKIYFASFEVFFEENLPRLFARFKHNNLTPDIYLIDWIFTMFSKALSLDMACRVWDMFCRDGEEFLFKTAIAILHLHEKSLLAMEFIQAAQFLTRLPTDSFTHHELFSHICDVTMVSRSNRRWKDVLSLLGQSDVTI